MDLGKPITGLPTPSSPFPEPGRSDVLALGTPGSAPEPSVVTDRDRVAEPMPTTIDIPMPGFWKFAQAWALFVFIAFLAIILALRLPSELGVLLPVAAVYLGLAWRITRSSISGSAQRLVVPCAGGLLRRTLPAVTSVRISDRHLLRRGVWTLRFVSDGRETPALVVPRLPWDLVKPSPLNRPPGDREWIAHAVPELMAAGIDVTYERR